MRLAIVGSTQFDQDMPATEWATMLIEKVLAQYKPEAVVSGGAIGIDSLGVKLAEVVGIEVVEFLPATKNWAGYKARNLLIAEECTHLLCLRHRDSQTYGSGWTADQAEKLGKPVRRYTW